MNTIITMRQDIRILSELSGLTTDEVCEKLINLEMNITDVIEYYKLNNKFPDL